MWRTVRVSYNVQYRRINLDQFNLSLHTERSKIWYLQVD